MAGAVHPAADRFDIAGDIAVVVVDIDAVEVGGHLLEGVERPA
jgi:hypothetical protein